MNQNQTRRPPFSDADIDQLEETLRRINAVADIEWEFYGTDLQVMGLNFDEPNETITFTNWRSAKAGLEMWLAGYNAGFGAASDEIERRDRHD